MLLPISLTLIFEVLVAITILYVATRKDSSKSMYLLITLFANFLMLHTFLLEVQSTSLEQAKQALTVQFTGYITYISFYFLTTLEACNIKVKKSYVTVAFIYVFLTFMVVLTNDFHHLYFSDFAFTINNSGFGILSYEYGFVGNINSYAIYILMLLSISNIVYHYSLWSSSLKHRLNHFLVGSLLGFALYGIIASKIIYLPFDTTYFILTISPLIYTIGVYKHNSFDVKSLAIQNSVDSMQTSIVILDEDWNYIYSNKRAHQHVTSLKTAKTGESLENIKDVPEYIKKPLEAGTYQFDFYIEKTYYYVQCIVDTIAITNKSNAYILTFINITPLKEELNKAVDIAAKDPLTGALNRRSFYEVLYNNNNTSSRTKIALAILDIDNFKNINDTYGHPFGDEVLRTLVNTINNVLEKHQVLCRYGGEEFVIYLPNTTENYALKTYTSIVEAVREIQIPYEDTIVRFTISLGYKVTTNHVGFDETIELADKALYVAKTTGKDKVCNADDVL